jgi:hypothetical protein
LQLFTIHIASNQLIKINTSFKVFQLNYPILMEIKLKKNLRGESEKKIDNNNGRDAPQ